MASYRQVRGQVATCKFLSIAPHLSGFKQAMPPGFLHGQAKGRAIIGWGFSQGAKWLIEMVQEHALLEVAVMPSAIVLSACCILWQTQSVACVKPSSSTTWQSTWLNSVAMVAGSVASMSSFLGPCLPGNNGAAHIMWLQWQVQCPLYSISGWR